MSESKNSEVQSGNGFLVAGILAALGASACCLGPLVLIALGVSGAWISTLTALEPYRPFFIGLTLLFLALAFHRLYLAPRVCTPGFGLRQSAHVKPTALGILDRDILGAWPYRRTVVHPLIYSL